MTAATAPRPSSPPSPLRIPRVRLIVRKGERGLSGAILYGWQNTDASILGVMDADLQHPPEILPQLLQAILEGPTWPSAAATPRAGNWAHWNPLRKASFCRGRLGHLAAADLPASAPKTPCPASSWCAGVACSHVDFRNRLQAAAGGPGPRRISNRSRRFPSPLACAAEVSARPTSRWVGTMRCFWQALRCKVRPAAPAADLCAAPTAPAATSAAAETPPTPAKNTSAMRIPGSRLTSGTRSVAAT